jgi:hypothetical protein
MRRHERLSSVGMFVMYLLRLLDGSIFGSAGFGVVVSCVVCCRRLVVKRCGWVYSVFRWVKGSVWSGGSCSGERCVCYGRGRPVKERTGSVFWWRWCPCVGLWSVAGRGKHLYWRTATVVFSRG